MYIKPITKIHSTFAEAKKFFDEHGGISWFGDEKPLSLATLTQGKRNLIVGEPGVGKSLLLGKIKEHLDKNGVITALINLRQPQALQQIDEFVALKTDSSKALLLDALDEVKSSLFPSVLQKLEQISVQHPDLPIYLSSRWVFIRRYANSFNEYRFITISPFTHAQVHEYLRKSGQSENDVNELLNRIMPFGHRMLVIQIPRYLFYLESFLKEKGLPAAAQVSRNELFEYFIYLTLEFEGKKHLSEDLVAMTKRVLEKLALTMEIYQTNVITKDELMTFFDDLKSDLKIAALSQIGIDVFYKYSLLQPSKEDLNKIEFKNTEFQEYLAAKEITRFPDPSRTAFAFAVDSEINEIYPTWYNALTFLVDMQPTILEQLIEFSGLRADKFKVMDEAFLTFLSRIDPRVLPVDLRRTLLKDVIDYHERTLQWLPGQLTQAMPGFFDASLETYLKERVSKAEAKSGSKRFVPLGNLTYVTGYLLQDDVPLDRPYWRERFIKYASDKNENGVLQRHALLALEWLKDPSVVDELPAFLLDSEELLMRAFLSLHAQLDPDHPKSLEYAFEATRRNEFYGRYIFFGMNKSESIKKFLKTLIDDEKFRTEFLDDASIFHDRDQIIVEKIERVFDDEIRELCKDILAQTVHYNIAHNAERSVFIDGLWKLLRKGDPGFVPDMVDRIKNSPAGTTGLYFANNFFSQVIKKEDVESYIQAMVASQQAYAAHDVMVRIKFSKRLGAEDIYEAGRPFLKDEYKKWEETQTRAPESPAQKHAENLLEEFRKLLEPEPGTWSHNVFSFFNQHYRVLEPLLTQGDRERIIELFTGTVFKFTDPSKYDLTINNQHDGSTSYTTNRGIAVFGDAIITAKHINFDLRPYRQQLLNYIPFAYNDHLQIIFEVVKDIKAGEMAAVVGVYRTRSSDLWRHNPYSFIRALEQYHVVEAAPVLQVLILESAWEAHVRQDALPILDMLAPDTDYLKRVVKKFKDSTDEGERKLANVANGLLIKSHGDADAIRSRLLQAVERAAAFSRPKGGNLHSVDDLEDEISFGKSFAKPLMELKFPGYEKEYLQLLEDAMVIWGQGKEYHEYAGYLWGIVYAYFDNLKEGQKYLPLKLLEEKITSMKNREGVNWLAGRMVNLRRSYLSYVGKPDNVSKAIAKYNEMRECDEKKIRNSADLFRHVQDAFDSDLRRWIEGEGAYDILGHKINGSGRQEYEKLVQKTLKTQVENILLKRGFQVEVLREPQLLDEKRTDLLVRYGFSGPIVVEVKLASNKDIQGTKTTVIKRSASFKSMSRYMLGYGASHGIFMIIDNKGATNLPLVSAVFQKIQGVHVRSFDCRKMSTPKKEAKKKILKKRPKIRNKKVSARKASRRRT